MNFFFKGNIYSTVGKLNVHYTQSHVQLKTCFFEQPLSVISALLKLRHTKKQTKNVTRNSVGFRAKTTSVGSARICVLFYTVFFTEKAESHFVK